MRGVRAGREEQGGEFFLEILRVWRGRGPGKILPNSTWRGGPKSWLKILLRKWTLLYTLEDSNQKNLI